MKAVILAGGLGSRLSEETAVRPKPMVEIGGYPILWHIMKIYSAHGINDFIICLGYKGYMIKEYFANYFLHTADVTFDITKNSMQVHESASEPWRVTLVDTGEKTMTGGRLRRVCKYLSTGEDFCFTYGDGISNINITALIEKHKHCGRLATLTATQTVQRFGIVELSGDLVTAFREKPESGSGWINGGFFVLSPGVLEYIDDDSTIWERDPLERLARERQLEAYFHEGFWFSMDTLRDKQHLDELWKSGSAPWKVWH
jgi:glucose-1-phosphate cytidylyltransferase